MPSPLALLRAGPPPPNVALLPDALFFTRSVPIAAGASAAEAAGQAELALEGISPFPLAQLYYGSFWVPGAETALVFAAYRRRFTTDQVAGWAGAEVVLPAFATVLGADVQPATTIILHAPESLTAVHWDAGPVPARVLVRSLEIDTAPEDRARAREELIQAMGGSKAVIDVEEPLIPEPASDGELVFRQGTLVSRLSATHAAALDVRDKGELAALRGARRRDVLLWRVMLGCAAALVLFALGELALVGGRMWNDVRLAKVRMQKPTVDGIMNSQSLATRIDELATKRLLPFEMITMLVDDNRKPPEIIFNRVTASTQAGINKLTIEANAANPAQIGVYESTLRNVPTIERVETRDQRMRDGRATFTLLVTFKPEALKPADSIAQ